MRKIGVFTGTRAEYGLLYWVMKGLQLEKNIDFQLFVGGMHLSREFGFTVEQIEADGFNITERLDFLLSSDSSEAIAKSMALALMSASEAFNRHRPDLLVILGDRFEAMAIAQAAMILRVPIAHIHGGETTEGVIDEAVRHSISKMAHLHFSATESYRKRVIQLGEHPDRVFNFGAPGIDSIKQLKLLDREELSADLGFKLNEPYFVVTFHPVTLMDGGDSGALVNLISALNHYPNYKVLVSYPNADADNGELIKILDAYYQNNKDRVLLLRSLGQLRYLSALKHCKAALGNSSSGLIEAPSFGIPTLNIGDRQKGRLAGATVLSCDSTKSSITEGLCTILSSEFMEVCAREKNPYGIGRASQKIVSKLVSHPLNGLVKKQFYDLSGEK
jgi:UDP-hydrolysing UDP-N-acetyl-D-glucosamine 2-epimerase